MKQPIALEKLLVAMTLLSLLLCFPVSDVFAKDKTPNVRLEVIEPFLELSTGPGKGYPVFYAVERGEWIELIKSRADWYEVKTHRGKTGWAKREQLEKTRTMTGARMIFPQAGEDDFKRRQWEFGMITGILEDDPMAGIRVGYFLSDGISAEFSFSHVPGEFSRSFLTTANVLLQPYPDWRYSPYFSLGAGVLDNKPKSTLVGSEDSSSTIWGAAVGVRGYITRKFMFRLEYRQHIAIGDDDDNDELEELSAGLSFFY